MSDYTGCDCTDEYQVFEKDPNATLDYRFVWSAWLAGDEIATSTFLLPDGLTMLSNSNTDRTATILVSGGTACSRYRVTNRITTVNGRTTDRTVVIAIREQ